MSRFKRIKNKTTKKSSVSIDEKISALNKELEKTGMLSEKMTTDNVLSTSEYVPPQEYKEGEVPNHSGIGGEGFSQNSAGSGVAGDPPNHSDMSDLYNSDVGHPIYSSTSYNGVSSFGIVIGPSFGAGDSYGIIENGNIYRQVLGGFLAGGTRGPGNYETVYRNYLKVNEYSPGFYSQEQIDQALENWQLAIQVHAKLVEIGFDNSRFNVPWKGWRKAILFEDLSGTPTFNHPTKGTIHLVTFNLLGMPNTYAEQDARPPGTTNPQRRGLEDDPIFPGPIATLFGLGQRAFDWLRGKAEDRKKKRGEGKSLGDTQGKFMPSNPKFRGAGNNKNYDPKEPNGPASNNLINTFTQSGRKFGDYVSDKIEKGIDSALEYLSKPLPDRGRTGQGGRPLGDTTQRGGGVDSAGRYNLSLATNLPISIVTGQSMQIPVSKAGANSMQNSIKTPEQLNAFANALTFDKSTPTDAQNTINPVGKTDQVLGDGWQVQGGGTFNFNTKTNKLEMVFNKTLRDSSGGETRRPDGTFTDIPDLDIEKAKAITDKALANPFVDKFLTGLANLVKPLPIKTDRRTGTTTGEGYQVYNPNSPNYGKTYSNAWDLMKDNKDDIGYTNFRDKIADLSKKGAEGTVQGTASNAYAIRDFLQKLEVKSSIDSKGWKPFAQNSAIENLGGGKGHVYSKVEIPYNELKPELKAIVDQGRKSNVTESLDESVGLGLYEPEAMNVNLADIRKGVMPEYPKKPPAEMIDGYHEKSRIRPKKAKNEEPYLKIDRKDLIRSHRLKKSEADEMMNTINMINDYIRDNPADLIHAQMRYPVDDPRLAELNWKMDQMLEAGEKYMDSNFKENKKLYKRAMDRTKNNIKLTDPEYVQQKYDELRGTPKPKKTKLVGRLGKHLNKYESKSLFKHVNSKDFKKISERKLEKEKFLEKQEQERLDYINDINAEMDEFRSDWRNELKEQPAFKAVPIDTGKMTSSQSFAVFPNFPGSSDTGIRLDLDGGLGRDNSLASTDTGLGDPNFTGIFQFPTEAGGFVPAISFKAGGEINSAQISYGDFPLSGYAMPLGGKMSRSINQKKSEEINKELESSEEFTKKIEADALMKARVDSNIMTGNNLQDITTSFENVKVPFDQGKFSSYMRTNIEQFQISGAYEAEIEVLENKIRKTEEASSKNYAAKIVKFEKQIKQIKEKQRKIPIDPKYPKTKISQAQFDALLKEISPADYIEGEEILKNNFLGQLEKQKKELNKKIDSLMKKYPQFNGDPERILGKWNGSVQIPIFDGDNNEIKPIGAEIGKQLEMIRLKKNIFNRMIYDSFDPSSVTYTMPPTISDTSEPSPKEMKSSGDDIKTIADLEKFAPEIIQQEINLDDVKSLEDLPQNKVLETIAKLTRFQTGGLSLPFDLTIKYAMGDYTPVTTSPGAAFDNVTLRAIENAHIKTPGRNSVSPDNYVDMPSRFAQAAFQHFDYEVTPKGIRVKDDFNFTDPNEGGSTSIGAFAGLDHLLPDKIKAQTIATNLVKIGDKRAEMLGYDPRDDKFGIPINYLIPYRRLSQKQKKLFYPERFRNENKRGSAFSKIKKFRNK